MNSLEICILLSCVSVFVATIMIIANVIVNKKQKKYIESIKAGDIFCFRSDVDLYYRRIKEYKHEYENPFGLPTKSLVFPDNICIIKELKESETGETWVCYNIVNTPKQIVVAENTDLLIKHYRTLDEFLEFRERVERFEIQ